MTIRLLLVDDHASFRQALAFVLGGEVDMSVVAQASSLSEARGALRTLDEGPESVDVALVDINLPDGEGTALIGDLHAANLLALMLVLTAYSGRKQFVRAVKAGTARVLDKACDIGEVVRRHSPPLLGRAAQKPSEKGLRSNGSVGYRA